jgi:hypothetical protein
MVMGQQDEIDEEWDKEFGHKVKEKEKTITKKSQIGNDNGSTQSNFYYLINNELGVITSIQTNEK